MFGERSSTGRLVAPGILLVLLTALISGVSTFVNAFAVKDASSDAFVAVRNVAVAAMLVPLALLAGRTARARLTRADWGRLAAIGLIGGAIPFLLFFRGIQMATAAGGAATAAFGYRTLFLMATVIGVVALKERFSARVAVAAGLLLAGSALMLSLSAPVWTDGTLYVLAATAMWAGEYALSKRALRDLPSGTVALGRMGFGGLFLVAYVALSGQLGAIASFGAAQWQWVALSAVLLVGFVSTWYAGLKTVDLSVATSALVLAFPVTWALGVAFAGNPLAIPAAAGAVATVLGVGLAIGAGSLRETWAVLADAAVARIRRATHR